MHFISHILVQTLAVGSGLNYGNDIRSNELGIEYLADYSSKGPTADGRIKPDLVAPGHFLLTANANVDMVGECDGGVPDSRYGGRGDGVRYVSGTSFAAPSVAGAALQLRQYFIEGWCNTDRCCGSRGCGSSISPSNSLLKALLLNGAVPMTGRVQQVPNGAVLDESFEEYDGKQGFGRINLLNSVPLHGSNELKLIAVNDKAITDGDDHGYIIDIDSSTGCSSDLKVTLVWMDPPGATGCMDCLVNDLDVYLEDINSSTTYYPNGLGRRDTKNTVERIRINTSNGDRFRVVVKATNLVSEQRYSLAIAGCLADDIADITDITTPRNFQTNSPSGRHTSAPTSEEPTNKQQITQLTSCMSPDECNQARKQKGIKRMFVGPNFPSFGCFIKGNTAFFGIGGSKNQMEDADLPGYRERLMCQLEALELNVTMDFSAPSSDPSNQPSINPTMHPTAHPSDLTTEPTPKLTPWPTQLTAKPTQELSSDLILQPTYMPAEFSESSSEPTLSPSKFLSPSSEPSFKPSSGSDQLSQLPTKSTTTEIATKEAKWWPKMDKRKILCIFSEDYNNEVVRANAVFETEDECVEYLMTLLRKHG